jgi:hypothetical protein
MKGRRHSPEQVVRKLREADKLLAEGAEVADAGAAGPQARRDLAVSDEFEGISHAPAGPWGRIWRSAGCSG